MSNHQHTSGTNNNPTQVSGGIVGDRNTVGGTHNYYQSTIAPIAINKRRTKIRRLFGMNYKPILLAGGVSFMSGMVVMAVRLFDLIGNSASIISAWGYDVFYLVSIGLLFLSIPLIRLGAPFKAGAETRLLFVGSIEADRNGDLYQTDTIADCNVEGCGGTMRLYVGRDDEISPVFVCRRNASLHREHHDFATMPDVGDEYRARMGDKA